MLIMSYYCSIFKDEQGFRRIFRDIYETNEHKSEKEQKKYFLHYLLDIALKSDYSKEILGVVCEVFDMKKSELKFMKKEVEKWLTFHQIDRFSEEHLWVPQLLLQTGYPLTRLYSVYI